MATTEHFYTGNGSTTTFAFTFPYLANSDVKVEVDNVLKTENSSGLTNNDYSISSTNIVFNSAPASAADIHIYRNTNVDTAQAVYAAGSSIRAVDLNNNQTQVLYSTQESGGQLIRTSDIKDGAVTSAKIEDGTIATIDLANNAVTTAKIANDAITTAKVAADAITGAKIADNAINHEHLQNDSVRTSEIKDGNVTTAKIAADAITNAKIADNAIATEHIEASGVRTTNIQNSAVTTDKIAAAAVNESKIGTGAVTTAKIAADAITGAKIANDQINSEHYVDGSIDTAHIADAQITTAKLVNNAVTSAKIANDAITNTQIADDSIDSEHYVDGSIDTAHIANNAVTTAKIAANAVTNNEIGNDAIDSRNYVDGSIDLAHLANASVDNSKLADNAVTTAKIANGQVNSLKLADQSVTTAKIPNSQVTDAKLASNSVTTAKIASTAVTDAKLASNSVTTSKITDANVTTVKIADSNVTLAKLAGDLKRTSITNSDAQIPTSGAVVDYVAAQLAPIGGFEVIATDAAFPNTQPASGVVISIADGGGLVVNGSGTSTTGRTVGGSTVTINNFASNFNNTTVDPGVAILVSSTGSGQVYNYHKATLKEADLLSLSGDINDFAERYRVSADPDNLPNKDEGDLVYDTNADAMKVYDSTTSSWKEVTSTGEFKYLFLTGVGTSGAPTLNGSISQYDLRVGSNTGPAATVINAAQLIVSINGVVQKANSGTSAPSEGFAMVDANTIIFGSALQAGDSVFIVQIGSAVNLPNPGDNTVTAAKIASGAVTTAKIADDAVTGAKVAANLDIPDNNKIRFGTGNDLSIYHDGSGSYLLHNGTGFFLIQGNGTNNLNIRAKSGESSITCIPDGGVELFHNNVKKFETLSDGINVTGSLKVNGNTIATNNLSNVVEDTTPQLGGDLQSNGNDIDFADNDKAYFGTGNDLEIYHNGTDSIIDNSTGNLKIISPNNVEAIKVFTDGTVNIGANADNVKLRFGIGSDLQIYHDGTHSRIHNSTGNLNCKSAGYYFNNAAGTENMLDIVQNGAVKLYYDASQKLETTSSGISISGNAVATGNIQVNDNNKLYAGSSGDLRLYHNGTNSYIANHTGNLYLMANSSEVGIQIVPNGAVHLRYNDSNKVETGVDGEYGSFRATNGAGGWDGMAVGNSNIVFMGSQNDAGIWNDADNEWMLKCSRNGTTQLMHNGSTKINTESWGVTVNGEINCSSHINLGDNDRLNVGGGQDIQILHDGTNSFIKNTTGNLYINAKSTETGIQITPDDDVRLRYNNANKLYTTSWGAMIGGSVGGTVFSGLSNYQFYTGFDAGSTSTFGGIVLGSGPNGNSPFIAASKAGNGTGLNLGLRTNGSVRLLIQNNGNIGAPSGSNIYYASDQRLKKNVTPLDKGLEAIKALKPVSFNWIDGFCDVEKDPLYGFIAQEVQTVDSNLVSPFGDDVEIGDDPNNPDQVIKDPLRVNEKFIIPMLVKAVQELSAKVAALEAK